MFSKGGKRRPKALKQLAQQELGLTIQEGQHSSVDDARAALYLYQKHAGEAGQVWCAVDSYCCPAFISVGRGACGLCCCW